MEVATKNDVREIVDASVENKIIPMVTEVIGQVLDAVDDLAVSMKKGFDAVEARLGNLEDDVRDVKANTRQLNSIVREHSADIAEIKARL